VHQDFAQRTQSQSTESKQSKLAMPGMASFARGTRLKILTWGLPGILMLCLIAVLLFRSESDARTYLSGKPHEEWLSVMPVSAALPPLAPQRTILEQGDNSISALQRLGFDRTQAALIVDASKPVFSLHDVRAGHMFERRDNASSVEIHYTVDGLHRLHLVRNENEAWRAEMLISSVSGRQIIISGSIEDSLFLAAAKAGLDDRTAMNLVDIFSWDVDFSRDLRQGDSFKVVCDEMFDEQGKVVGTTIQAAEFINQGKVFRAIRFMADADHADYFSPDGKSMRKTYLKSPVKYSRISSRFSTARKHPVLGYTRAHRGVDYASPSGTPIRTIGEGRIIFAGWKGGYGRLVEIQHINHAHSTRYGHMRKIAKGITKGARVHQGQTIGYVGMSGVATGPHLHFEFRVRGQAVNPLTVRHTPAEPVPTGKMEAFNSISGQMVRQLDASPMMLAWE